MKKYYKKLGALFFAFLTLQLFVGVALADSDSDDILGTENDDDDDGVDDDKEEWNERDVKVEAGDDEIEIKSILTNGDRRDVFKLEVDFEDDEGLEVEFNYKSNVDSDDDGYELEFEVDFHEIIEYIDENGDGLYNPEEEEDIQEYEITNFQTPDYSKKENEDGSTRHKITISTIDNVFTARIYVVEEFMEIHDQMISPTEAKIDIIINNFNYQNDSSQLALYIKLESEEEYEEVEEEDNDDDDDTGDGDDDDDDEIDDDEEGIITEDNDFTGYFSWADTAIIDGVAKPVLSNSKTTDHEDHDEEKLYFNYPRGTLIIHDPKIGIAGVQIEDSPLFSLDNILFIALIVGTLAAAGVSTILIIKKRKKSKRSKLIPEEKII